MGNTFALENNGNLCCVAFIIKKEEVGLRLVTLEPGYSQRSLWGAVKLCSHGVKWPQKISVCIWTSAEVAQWWVPALQGEDLHKRWIAGLAGCRPSPGLVGLPLLKGVRQSESREAHTTFIQKLIPKNLNVDWTCIFFSFHYSLNSTAIHTFVLLWVLQVK